MREEVSQRMLAVLLEESEWRLASASKEHA